MGALADEFVRVRADTSYLAKDLKKQGRTSGDNLGKGILGGLKSIAGPAAAILAGIGVISFLKDASEAARDSQKVGKQTNAVLKSTGGAAKVTRADIEKLTTALSKKTGIDDEAIQSSANLLLSFTGVRNETGKGNKIFDQATGLIQDMSVALGQDGKTSAIQLGKALNDPIAGVGSLRRVGVQLTDQQKAQIIQLVKHGDKLAAQKIILHELTTEFGGSAEAQATWADKSKVAMDNVKENVGELLNKTLEPVAKWFVEVGLPAVQDFFKKISTDKNLKAAIGNLKDALTTLTGDVSFRESLDSIANSLPGIVNGLADIVTKYDEIADAVDRFENMSFAGGDERGGPVGQIIQDFKAGGTIEVALVHFRNTAPGFVKEGWARVKADFASSIADIVTKTKEGWARVEADFARSIADIVTKVKEGWGRVKADFASSIADIVTKVKEGWGRVKADFASSIADIVTKVTRFKDRVAGVFVNLKNRVVSTAKSMMNTIKTGINTGLNAVQTVFSKAVTAVGRIWDKVKSAVAVPIKFVVDDVINNGLLAAFRKISKLVGYRAGETFTVSYQGAPKIQSGTAAGRASGGPIRGHGGPRQDNIAGIDRRTHRQTAWVSAKEYVVNARAYARNKTLVEAINRDGLHKPLHRASGGAIPGLFLGGTSPVPGSWNRHSGYSWATWAGDNPTPMNTPVRAWKAGIIAAVRHLTTSYGTHIIENVGGAQAYYAHLARAAVNAGQSVRQGQLIGYSDSTGNSTGPHLHFELRGGNAAIGSAANGGGGSVGIDAAKYLAMVTGALGKLKSIEGTPFGKMIGAGARLIGGKVKDKITSLASSFVGAAGAAFTSLTGGSNRSIGKRMMLQRWGAGEWPALNSLWTKESGWNERALNRSSGAYGIPQSLPGSKMASAGADWRTNPATQIKWGLGYIAGRYGSPSSAWRHSQATNWYGAGGVINEPVIGMGMRTGARYGFGEHGPETVTPGRSGRPINIIIDLGDGVREVIQGELDQHDEFHASIARMR